ncbi:MAG TPA: putative manganese-dependent inorganic diphosphatase [Candidatus Bariatricus faecipullorum]|nr:putative manganese-dependent inorganic diphosphatase [Candidatus Bariatricus faecipullorum]
MEHKKARKTYVVGHRNPDTDSICSAIAYAHLKEEITGEEFSARRAGELNEETAYVLRKFQVSPPSYLSNVHLQVKDLDIHKVEGIPEHISIKEAWEKMKELNIKTMPITRNRKLEGLISTGDIATSYMDVYDSRALSRARTQYRNIVSTLNGTLVTGNDHGYFLNGKVVIAASSPDLMENFMEKDDLVILGNRYESQLCAIEMDASCLVICQNSEVSKTIRKMAEEREIVVIVTPYDTFTAARLINQSIPVKYFMSRENLETFRLNDYVDEVKEVMAKKKYRDFPVLDKKGHFYGFISRRRLISSRKKQVILVDHNEKSQAVDGIEEAEILEIIDHHRLGSLETMGPVYFRNQPVGCTATIIYQMYQENGVEVDKTTAALLCSAILSDTLLFRSPTCTMVDKAAAEALARIAGLDMEEHAREMFRAGSSLGSKTPEEIFFQDFKVFSAGDTMFGVGQINAMGAEELEHVKEKLAGYLPEARVNQGMQMVFIMLTDILEESTELLCDGEGAREAVLEAFGLPEETERILLKGVVSRKKQLIPPLVNYLQQ